MRSIAVLVWGCVALGAARADWVREIEIASEPVKEGSKVFTVRFAPESTVQYDYISFECVYHQEFPWMNPRGEKYTKIHEPVNFHYRRETPKFVADLDHYISFRVPMDLEDLSFKFGPTTFNQNYPITVPRMKISAIAAGQTVWSLELPSQGKHDVSSVMPKTETPKSDAPKPEEGKKEETPEMKTEVKPDRDIGTDFLGKFGPSK